MDLRCRCPRFLKDSRSRSGWLRSCSLLGALLFTPWLAHGSSLVWPVPGDPVAEGKGYAEFGQTTASGEPESALFGCVRNDGDRFHEAIDIAPVLPRRKGEATDPVVAVMDGVIGHINNVAGNSSYGRYVVMEHPEADLPIYTLYAHLASIEANLRPGMKVAAGTRLGTMGRSAGGYSIPRDRAHLHLEAGLRLSEHFERWYRQQPFDSPNHHGNFNGMNLVGWDPVDWFTAERSGRAPTPLTYLESLAPGVMLHLRTSRRPDFLDRYPMLELPGCPPAARAGWEILLSPWGLPLSLKALTAGELRGVQKAGDASVVAIDRTALTPFACRDLVVERSGQLKPGPGAETVLQLLFTPAGAD